MITGNVTNSKQSFGEVDYQSYVSFTLPGSKSWSTIRNIRYLVRNFVDYYTHTFPTVNLIDRGIRVEMANRIVLKVPRHLPKWGCVITFF